MAFSRSTRLRNSVESNDRFNFIRTPTSGFVADNIDRHVDQVFGVELEDEEEEELDGGGNGRKSAEICDRHRRKEFVYSGNKNGRNSIERAIRRKGRPPKHRDDTANQNTETSVCNLDTEQNSLEGKNSGPKKNKQKKGHLQTGRPAELFRTDFITAMKVNENETYLDMGHCFIVSDPWRQEWNKGVQVPVKANAVPEIEFQAVNETHTFPHNGSNKRTFSLPRKFVRLTKNDAFDSEKHHYFSSFRKSENVCRYDLDDTDVRWLHVYNRNKSKKDEKLSEQLMERIIEQLEVACFQNIRRAAMDAGVRTERQQREDDAACDVCFQDDSELDDQIVFCDRCDVAVHQSCYGTGQLPEGTWICRACRISPSRRQKCILCPNRGGALKCTRTGEKWAHVSCVWWIPEVRFENPETMEPIINVAKIPVERWNLKCILCRKMEGACIQCSEKSCLVAYHVTCAQHYKLYMQMNSNKIKGELNLLSYCPKHHRGQDGEPAQFTLSTPNKQRATFDGTSSPYRSPGVKSNSAVGRQDGSPKKFDQQKRKELEERFSEFASPDSVVKSLKGSVSKSLVSDVYLYWRLKRKHNHSKPLLTPKQEEDKFLKEHEEREYTRLIKILIALRQNLEKARNLCYMVVRANKLKYQYRKILEDQFELFSRATSRPDISKRDTVMLEKYLTPVPGRLNLYERVLMGREESVEEKIADGGDYRSESTDSGHDGPSPSLRLSAAEHFSNHSPDNKRNYSGKERIKRNGLSNHLFPVDGSMCISSKSGEELAFSPSRDRNFNLSPKPLLKKQQGDGQQNMGWNGKLNGLVTYGRGRKRKHWQSNGEKLEHSFSPMALNERSNFYSSVTRGSDSKRAKLRGSDKWSKTLRSKIKNT